MSIRMLELIEWVAKNSQQVTIDEKAVNRLAKDFRMSMVPKFPLSCPFKFLPFRTVEEAIDFWFIADSMAFCFWGYPKKWTIKYDGRFFDGWWALLASFRRAYENGIPIIRGDYLANLTDNQAKELFAGEIEIPMLIERVEILKGIGRVLVNKYQGSFSNFLQHAPTDALELVEWIAVVFPGFADEAMYKGRRVYFYKKAQLFVGDLVQMGDVGGLMRLTGYEKLTGEADYKIPALLRSFEVLQYTHELADKVDNRIELPWGLEEEVEIRANMLWAIQLMLKQIHKRFKTLTATQLDRALWQMSQDKSLIKQPYHLTRTVNY